MDPAHEDPDLRAIVDQSLASCGVSANVRLTASRSPEGVHVLAAERGKTWNLFVIDGDHEHPAPERDVRACLPYADRDCAFVFHDLASPMVAAGFRFLQREGFNVLVYQTSQIMGIAWRGKVTPITHLPDPDVAWQLPHHLVGLPVSGVEFDANFTDRTPLLNDSPQPAQLTGEIIRQRLERDRERQPGLPPVTDAQDREAGNWRPSVCIVSSEIIGPFTNGGIGTRSTCPAPHPSVCGITLTLLSTVTVLASYNYSERLSVKCADVLWSPSTYLIEWAERRGFELPKQKFVRQYCLPSQRLRESGEGPSGFPAVKYGRTTPPKEIVFFGRLEERKGLRLFCNAIHRLREELADRNISVVFLGKAETCGGMSSLADVAHRSRDWRFQVKTVTNR